MKGSKNLRDDHAHGSIHRGEERLRLSFPAGLSSHNTPCLLKHVCPSRTLTMRSLAPMFALALILSALPVSWAAEPPRELYSPLVSSKILATARDTRDGKSYPHNTDQVNGIWNYVATDWWTSGFFPATLYSMNRRSELCPDTVDKVDWVNLGQTWSADLTSLLINNSVGHDVGFISFPFFNEVAM